MAGETLRAVPASSCASCGFPAARGPALFRADGRRARPSALPLLPTPIAGRLAPVRISDFQSPLPNLTTLLMMGLGAARGLPGAPGLPCEPVCATLTTEQSLRKGAALRCLQRVGVVVPEPQG
jgi:hypothetical protein